MFWDVLLGDSGWALPLQIEKEEQAAAEKAVTKEEFQTEWTAPAPEFTAPPQPEVADWSEGVQVPSVPIQQFPTGQFGGCLWGGVEGVVGGRSWGALSIVVFVIAEDWSAQPATEDWSAAPTAQATEWVGTATEWS